jgi:alpha-aminoadipate carrier protein LysW
MQKEVPMVKVYCIDCEQPITLERQPREGEIIVCPSCGTELEVIGVEPTELDWLYLNPLRSEEDRGRPFLNAFRS